MVKHKRSVIQGHGTIKKLRTGAVVSVLGLSTVFGGSVLAEEVVVTPSEGVVTTEEVVAPVTEDVTDIGEGVVVAPVTEEEVAPVTEEDVAEAKGVWQEAQANEKAQEEVVSGLEGSVASAEAEVSSIEGEIASVEVVTEEQVNQAKKEAEKAEGDVTKAEEVVSKAKANVVSTQEKVDQQSKVVDEAKAEVDKAQSKVADASEKVDTLSGGVSIVELEGNVTSLSKQVADDKKALSSAEAEYESGKAYLENKEKAISKQQSVVDSAKSSLGSAKVAYDSSVSAKASAEGVVADAEKNLLYAKDALGSVNILPISSEYIKALKEYKENPSQELSDRLTSIGEKLMVEGGYPEEVLNGAYPVNAFDNFGTFSIKDKEWVLDPTNLSYDERMEIAKFVVGLVNPVREAYGLEPMVISSEMMKASEYIAENSKQKWHNFNVIYEAGVMIHGNSWGISENKSFIEEYESKTMAGLKRGILQGLYWMFYEDAHMNWVHAYNFLGGNSGGNDMMGIATADGDNYGNVNSLDIFYNFANSSKVVTKNTNTFTEVEDTASELARAYSKALDAYNTAKSSLDDASKKADSALGAYRSAESKYNEAVSALNTLKEGNVDIVALEGAVNSAKAQLEKDENSLEVAKETLELAKASESERAKALEEAKAELAEARSAYDSVYGVFSKESETLQILKNANDVAKLALAKAEEDLASAIDKAKQAKVRADKLIANYSNSRTTLLRLDNQLKIASSKLEDLRSQLADALEVLSERKDATNEALLAYLGVKAEFEGIDDVLKKAERILASGSEVVAVVNDNGDIVGVLSADELSLTDNGTIQTIDGKIYTINEDGTVTEIIVPVTEKDNKTTSSQVVENTNGIITTQAVKSSLTETKSVYSRVARANEEKSLPNTNDSASIVGLLGVMLSGLGAVSLKRKRG